MSKRTLAIVAAIILIPTILLFLVSYFVQPLLPAPWNNALILLGVVLGSVAAIVSAVTDAVTLAERISPPDDPPVDEPIEPTAGPISAEMPSVSIGGNVAGPVVVGDGNVVSMTSGSEPATTPASGSISRVALLDQMDKAFSMNDSAEICLALNVDVENLAGDGKRAKLRELILQMEREKRLPELRAQCRQRRPQFNW